MNESNIGGKFDEITGKIKQGIGEAIGNEKLANEGAAQEVKGHAKETWGNVKDAAGDLGNSAGSTTHSDTTDARHDITNAAERTKDNIDHGIDSLKR